MDDVTAPSTQDKPPTLSSDPKQHARLTDPADTSTKNITAQDTVPTLADGTANAQPRATDGPKDPHPSASQDTGPGVEYKAHLKGTAAPGSHSELFGLTPGEKKVHPPPGSGPGSGVLGTTGHKGTHNSVAGEEASSGQGNTAEDGDDEAKPGLIDRLNPMKDSTGDGKKGVGN